MLLELFHQQLGCADPAAARDDHVESDLLVLPAFEGRADMDRDIADLDLLQIVNMMVSV